MSSYYDTVAMMIDDKGDDTVAKVEIIGAVKVRVRRYLRRISKVILLTDGYRFGQIESATQALLSHTKYEEPEFYLQDLHSMAHDLGTLRLRHRHRAGATFGDNPYWHDEDRSEVP